MTTINVCLIDGFGPCNVEVEASLSAIAKLIGLDSEEDMQFLILTEGRIQCLNPAFAYSVIVSHKDFKKHL